MEGETKFSQSEKQHSKLKSLRHTVSHPLVCCESLIAQFLLWYLQPQLINKPITALRSWGWLPLCTQVGFKFTLSASLTLSARGKILSQCSMQPFVHKGCYFLNRQGLGRSFKQCFKRLIRTLNAHMFNIGIGNKYIAVKFVILNLCF